MITLIANDLQKLKQPIGVFLGADESDENGNEEISTDAPESDEEENSTGSAVSDDESGSEENSTGSPESKSNEISTGSSEMGSDEQNSTDAPEPDDESGSEEQNSTDAPEPDDESGSAEQNSTDEPEPDDETGSDEQSTLMRRCINVMCSLGGLPSEAQVIANLMPWIPGPNEERQQKQGSRAKQSRSTCTSERSPGKSFHRSLRWFDGALTRIDTSTP